MIKSKKQMFIVIGVFTLVMLLGTVTYAFFNYTRTGPANTISVGRISFVSRQTQTISLTNLFPIDPSETGIMDDDTKVGTLEIEIEGDTDYTQGVEYLISATDANIYTSTGQVVPITLDFTITGLGTSNANYFTERENKNANIYKKLVGDTLVGDQMLLVGYIKPNTTSGQIEGVNGKITIKAYLDKNKIAISDTYDGTESDNMGTTNNWVDDRTVITTEEWNALQNTGISFKVKVEANEGIWVKGSLEEIMKQENFDSTKNRGILDNEQSEFVTGENGIDFGAISSDTNGKGVYMRAGTENDANPILYYRGAIEDNNVVFANKCWKAVRTTETGGVKLVYNGEYSSLREPLSSSDYTILTNTGNFVFDSTDNTWTTTLTDTVGSSSNRLEISFSIPNGDGYTLEMYGTIGTKFSATAYLGVSGTYSSVGGFSGNINSSNGETSYSRYIPFDNHTFQSEDSVKITYFGVGTNENATVLKFRLTRPNDNLGLGCDGKGQRITVEGQSRFPFHSLTNSPAYVGYMYGDVYTTAMASKTNTSEWNNNARFGSSFTWDGTNYTLVGDTVTTPDATHHYSCNTSVENGACSEIRYVFHYADIYNYFYYITLTGGVGIEEALDKMNVNTHDSNAKHIVDTWYANNIASYTNRFEDTVWCNDRSITEYNSWSPTASFGTGQLYYGSYARSGWVQNTNPEKNHPSLVCVNKNDRFTVSNSFGNMALTYPTGLLTADEIVFAGGFIGAKNVDYYLYNGGGEYEYTMSPSRVSLYATVYSYGINFVDASTNSEDGLMATSFIPSVSLKPGQLITEGTGTESDPYIIK